ncbi:3-isopropylmalate dehydratase small subunit [Amycolatopsis sp. NPDC004079]|uniref:3-isopropylmalate dehydratase small subunit n=1 Tax=Amycolatopsis sp. NPDC004079 TaxID=3154549 RepID=UPI0033ADDC35
MRPLTEHTGKIVPLHRDDVDTDQIIPAEHCKRLTASGYADVLFEGWREDPRFALNQREHADATILLGGHNFGTGSSREHAVWALRDWGFKAVVASSFGDIFRRNAWKNGLMAVQLPAAVVAWLTAMTDAGTLRELTVDLVARELRAAGARHGFAVDSRARMLLLKGMDDIGLTLEQDAAISAYERARPGWLPRVRRVSATEPSAGG